MTRRPVFPLLAGAATALSFSTTVLAVFGSRDGYEWLVAKCGEVPEVYPELGWALMILPLASVGALCGAAALWITRNRSSARAAVPWFLLSLSILAGGGSAILSAIMLADPCGMGS